MNEAFFVMTVADGFHAVQPRQDFRCGVQHAGHIGGDFLLIYQVVENRIHFVRAGTHSELFSS